ncbi:AhpC/TSA family protein [Chitinophaga sedimenti]|uniref:TlpA disulfide reductase family protein n=1 Tax=Chitinophaga sedimenti TaxID=2033606 RepID=UPI002004C2B2|nr:TlpA disulfide reductase family protein [Chitinophaga sedimenti]MCK7554031.1 AhpC/TSA family protein [Chitinophaga sedimenti]
MKQLICILAAGLLWQSANAQSYRVTGKLEGLNNDSVLLIVRKSNMAFDTLRTRARAGKFRFTGKVNGVQQATLVPGGLRSRKFFRFYAEPGNITLAGHSDTMDYIRAYGTPNNRLQTEERIREREQYAIVKQLRDEGKTAASEKLYDEIWAAKRAIIRQHPNTMVSVMNFYVLASRVPLDTALALYEVLSPAMKQTDFAKDTRQRLAKRETVRVGKPAPTFEAVDMDGKPVSTAGLKGKYVLLDFWASWCVPCRAENPYVVAAYQQYKDKGFTVVSVSLDNDGKKWRDAIAKDGLTWQHISELKAPDEPIANLYGVQSIPDNFLISPEGQIVAAQLRGEELKKT